MAKNQNMKCGDGRGESDEIVNRTCKNHVQRPQSAAKIPIVDAVTSVTQTTQGDTARRVDKDSTTFAPMATKVLPVRTQGPRKKRDDIEIEPHTNPTKAEGN